MGRRYTRASYLSTIEAVRRVRPDIAFSTDLIVGFPGESEPDFLSSLSLMREVGYGSSFSFKYCDRPGVLAARLEPKVPEQVKAERLERLQTLQAELSAAVLAAQVGRRVEVLVEGPSRKGRDEWTGRDGAGRIVNFAHSGPDFPDSPDSMEGRLVLVDILKAKKHSLWGKAGSVPW
jgi:tRNA-2-methylthio-N6-dimethylallyladenosine synthase